MRWEIFNRKERKGRKDDRNAETEKRHRPIAAGPVREKIGETREKTGEIGGKLLLLRDTPRGNLVGFRGVPHTRFTYHRTWETGLEMGIEGHHCQPRFFCPYRRRLSTVSTSKYMEPFSGNPLES